MKNFFSLVFIILLMASCSSEAPKSTTTEKPSAMSGKNSTPTDSDMVELVITGNDQMQYDKSELHAKAGQKIKLTLKHSGKMARETMGHNLVILKKGTNLDEFAKKAMVAVDNDYIPEGDAVIAHTKMIGGGQSSTITFDAPDAGTYDFICSFPGHYGMMRGKLIVK